MLDLPRDPDFEEKAGRILDLYHRVWKGRRLRSDEFVICADEKTSIQARARKHPSAKTRPGLPLRVEHEYTRLGAWAYLAALDVHRFRISSVAANERTASPASTAWSPRP